MKLRHVLASAAATAVIAPAALFAAGSASAAPDTATTGPSAGATTEVTDTATPTASSTTSAPATPTTSAPTSPSTPTSPATTAPTSAPATTEPPNGTTCDSSDDEVPRVDDKLTADITGLPAQIKAGSGWHGFDLSVANSSGTDYRRVDFGLFATQIDSDTWNVDTSHLKLEFQNPDTGAWTAVSLAEDDPAAGYLGYTEVKPHDSFKLKARIQVDAKAKAGDGFVIGIGVYADDNGKCVEAGGDNGVAEFAVVAADGSTGGGSGTGTQSGGQKPLPAKPAGDTHLNPSGGDLAETGSSSATPTIAAVGGAVVVLGAGSVFLLRRRKPGAGGTTTG
ncbi:LAETG motif-containing sortase-dependent surface protein [Actinacidiphila paucisporea]|uniref:LPXTG-motif cell wall anchor domain-containing protein n=1 Tax=Actinacidiphila paucisporea TaxID=310782 RepID=A0A1M7H9Q1_9ACTN|nr:LAETG motif-containing sortase-dependent surface protein [Actinacidiphila paucisporea]SHM25332.1 LPXTG-motif cell wall anchor domain-containing protein [Actinacidiphila paucisporea]